MSTKIEFHVVQSFPPANLNRDDTNMPKDCEFGGVRRARISSQCIKRAIRLHPDFEKYTEVLPSVRTKKLSSKLVEVLSQKVENHELAVNAANVFAAELLSGMDKEGIEKGKTRVAFYFSEKEVIDFSETIVKNWEEIEKILSKLNVEKHLEGKFRDAKTRKFNKFIKSYTKTFKKQHRLEPDIALFGRMLALHPDLSMKASCQVAHAISTHRINMEMDFFTAVDDLQTDEETGADMMGTTGFNSATFYRYAAIDWGQLTHNLGDDIELAQKTVAGFTSALVKAIPTGKQNAFAAQTPPTLVLVIVREDGGAWSLANAFEKPISNTHGESILCGSIKALDKHWDRLNSVYGDPDKPVKPFLLLLDDECELTYLKDAQVPSLSKLIEAVQHSLPKE